MTYTNTKACTITHVAKDGYTILSTHSSEVSPRPNWGLSAWCHPCQQWFFPAPITEAFVEELRGGTLAVLDKQRKQAARPKPRKPRKQRLPDPERMNKQRADAAATALDAFTEFFGEKAWSGMKKSERQDLLEQNLMDMLGDIGHFCDRNGIDLENQLRQAARHYNAETSNRGEQFDFTDQTKDPSEGTPGITWVARAESEQRRHNDKSGDPNHSCLACPGEMFAEGGR